MKKDGHIAIEAYHHLQNIASTPSKHEINIHFKGYSVKDCNCQYCLYYSKKRKACTIPECCCLEERRQTAAAAAINELEVPL